MIKPLVAVLTQDRQLSADLSTQLHERFELATCHSIGDVEDLVNGEAPSALLADFRAMRDGGHQEDRLLDDLQIRVPDLAIVMLTDEACPETLERRSACTEITHVRGYANAAQLTEALQRSLTAVPVGAGVGGPATGVPRGFGEDLVIYSIAQGFETKTSHVQAMLEDLDVAAKHNVSILLIGETGSGKTYLSRLIHEVSPRRNDPFLHVACGALPNELIESELFGHVKGAFTSAHADKEGKFIAAGRGTILLDEIDVLGPEQQVKLLRVIETGEFEPVGSNRTLQSQARLVVASNLDLQPLVDQGRFRPDLYYRLNMLKFEIPPLRHRKPDITPLARMFIRQLAEKHRVEIKRIDRSFFEALHAYPWPGNVRELENVIQRTVIFCRDGVLSSSQLPPHIIAGAAGPASDPNVALEMPVNHDDDAHLGQQMALTEQELIEQALFRNNFSRTNTAKQLGISRVTLYNKMKKYGIMRK